MADNKTNPAAPLIEVEAVDRHEIAIMGDNSMSSSINKQGQQSIDQFLDTDKALGGPKAIGSMRNSKYSYIAGEHGLTRFQGALAILSTCVGAGIVGLPKSMYSLGIPISVFLQILVIWVTHTSSNLYLYVKDLVPDHPESLYEIGYLLMGRASIFVLASTFIVNSFGLCLIYFSVFGDTAG